MFLFVCFSITGERERSGRCLSTCPAPPSERTVDVFLFVCFSITGERERSGTCLSTCLAPPSERTVDVFLFVCFSITGEPERSGRCLSTCLAPPSERTVDVFLFVFQHHRRARALRKMPFYLSSTTFRADTLLQIILPLVNSFLQDECYAKFADLIEASVEATGAICSYLPWSKYMQQLQTYLRKLTRSLDNHKLMIRSVYALISYIYCAYWMVIGISLIVTFTSILTLPMLRLLSSKE